MTMMKDEILVVYSPSTSLCIHFPWGRHFATALHTVAIATGKIAPHLGPLQNARYASPANLQGTNCACKLVSLATQIVSVSKGQCRLSSCHKLPCVQLRKYT